MRTIVWAAILAALFAVGCGPGDVERPAPEGDTTLATAPQAADLGQLVYVPVYSHIYYRDAQRQMNLTATLSTRNADLRQSITIHRVGYYDSEGALVRPYDGLHEGHFVPHGRLSDFGIGGALSARRSDHGPHAEQVQSSKG